MAGMELSLLCSLFPSELLPRALRNSLIPKSCLVLGMGVKVGMQRSPLGKGISEANPGKGAWNFFPCCRTPGHLIPKELLRVCLRSWESGTQQGMLSDQQRVLLLLLLDLLQDFCTFQQLLERSNSSCSRQPWDSVWSCIPKRLQGWGCQEG